MLRSKRNRRGVCAWGCCHDGLPKRIERRIIKRREARAWKKEAYA